MKLPEPREESAASLKVLPGVHHTLQHRLICCSIEHRLALAPEQHACETLRQHLRLPLTHPRHASP